MMDCTCETGPQREGAPIKEVDPTAVPCEMMEPSELDAALHELDMLSTSPSNGLDYLSAKRQTLKLAVEMTSRFISRAMGLRIRPVAPHVRMRPYSLQQRPQARPCAPGLASTAAPAAAVVAEGLPHPHALDVDEARCCTRPRTRSENADIVEAIVDIVDKSYRLCPTAAATAPPPPMCLKKSRSLEDVRTERGAEFLQEDVELVSSCIRNLNMVE